MVRQVSKLFVPIRKVTNAPTHDIATHLLLTHGYIRQSSSGIYNLLPLGLILQRKIESVIRKRLDKINCSEISLTSLGLPELWKKSGRFGNTELFRIKHDDNQEVRYIINPTHEEEVTNMISNDIQSYRQLPLKLYQITRKYRDEKRPRGGLLRSREFLMKDLYSFDASYDEAIASYQQIRQAYNDIFDDLKLPVVRAEADSGSIGGSLSHEYHLLSEAGEDKVIHCYNCSYTANIERAISCGEIVDDVQMKRFTKDADEVELHYPTGRQLSHTLVKTHVPSFEDYTEITGPFVADQQTSSRKIYDVRVQAPNGAKTVPIVSAESGESCPVCHEPGLQQSNAIELGHTFYLGTKYSAPLNAVVNTDKNKPVAIEMGCYGIGISRLIAAIAEHYHDQDGLKWPKALSPYDCVVLAGPQVSADTVNRIIDSINLKGIYCLYDDRSLQLGQLLAMSKGFGFPVTVIIGNKFVKTGLVEVQCRDGRSESVTPNDIPKTITEMLERYI